MSEEELKKATEKYIDVILGQAEDKAGICITETIVESTAFVDKLSSSLLITSGAAITLCIGNSKALITALGAGSFKLLIILLLISAVLGFFSKTCHALSLMHINLAKELITKFNKIFDEFDKFEEEQIEKVKDRVEIKPRNPSLGKIFESFTSTLPSFLQKQAKKGIAKGVGDSKRAQRMASTYAYFHIITFGVQSLFMTIAFLSAVLGIE